METVTLISQNKSDVVSADRYRGQYIAQQPYTFFIKIQLIRILRLKFPKI